MKKNILALVFILESYAVIAGERELFTSEEKKILSYLKSPSFLLEKMLEEHQKEGRRIFTFLLGINSVEDRADLKKLNYNVFSHEEDASMLKEIQDRFLERMRKLEELP